MSSYETSYVKQLTEMFTLAGEDALEQTPSTQCTAIVPHVTSPSTSHFDRKSSVTSSEEDNAMPPVARASQCFSSSVFLETPSKDATQVKERSLAQPTPDKGEPQRIYRSVSFRQQCDSIISEIIADAPACSEPQREPSAVVVPAVGSFKAYLQKNPGKNKLPQDSVITTQGSRTSMLRVKRDSAVDLSKDGTPADFVQKGKRSSQTSAASSSAMKRPSSCTVGARASKRKRTFGVPRRTAEEMAERKKLMNWTHWKAYDMTLKELLDKGESKEEAVVKARAAGCCASAEWRRQHP